MKLLLITITVIFFSCSKTIGLKEPTCRFVVLLSDKYSHDSVYIRTDTLYGKGNLTYVCGRDLDSCKSRPDHWIVLCADATFECWRYVFDKQITQPLIFK